MKNILRSDMIKKISRMWLQIALMIGIAAALILILNGLTNEINRLDTIVGQKQAELESMQTYMRFLIDRAKEDRAALMAEREMREFFETNISHAAKALNSALDDYYTAQVRIYELEKEIQEQ